MIIQKIMPEYNYLEISAAILLLITFIIQLVYYWFVFSKLAFHREEEGQTSGLPPVSVVVSAHNEYYNLKENLPVLLGQDYPDFEVVVVNHASEDDTAVLLKEFQQKYPLLKVITIEQDLNFFHGKKFPLSIGIKSASHEVLLLTDADCRPNSPYWIQKMAANYKDNTEVVLGYGPYQPEKSFLNRMIRYDTFMVAMHYLSFALKGFPYMGVGRNLSYRKSLFFNQKGFTAHYLLASGDDDLFIGEVANKKNTKVELSPKSFVYSKPKHSFKTWFIQKRRHLTTGTKYKTRFKFLLGTYSLSLVFFYIALLFLLITRSILYFLLATWLLRLITQLIIHKKILHRLQEKQLLLFSLLWEPVYALIVPILGLIGLTSKYSKWE